MFPEIVMQGDVMAPLLSSLPVDTMGKECLEEEKHLYFYKNTVPIPMVDDLFTTSAFGYQTRLERRGCSLVLQNLLNFYIGKTCTEALCSDLFVNC